MRNLLAFFLIFSASVANAINSGCWTNQELIKLKPKNVEEEPYSRRILGWSLSTTRTMQLSVDALMYALKKRGLLRKSIP